MASKSTSSACWTRAKAHARLESACGSSDETRVGVAHTASATALKSDGEGCCAAANAQHAFATICAWNCEWTSGLSASATASQSVWTSRPSSYVSSPALTAPCTMLVRPRASQCVREHTDAVLTSIRRSAASLTWMNSRRSPKLCSLSWRPNLFHRLPRSTSSR
eukprot:1224729-Prymnesium_polylepis.1